MSNIDNLFPALPEISSGWVPVYFEPIIGSGERITSFLVFKSDDRFAIIRTMNDQRMYCLFGAQINKINKILDICEKSLELQLEEGISVNELKFPMTGFYSGEKFLVLGNTISDIKKHAIAQSSFLMSMDFRHDLLDENVDTKIKTEKWAFKIRNYSERLMPNNTKYFNNIVEFPAISAKVKYGFYNGIYVSNFAMIFPSRWNISVEIAKSKIYDLEYFNKIQTLDRPEKLELILSVNRKPGELLSRSANIRVGDTLTMIRESARRDGINVVLVENEEHAVQHIMKNVS